MSYFREGNQLTVQVDKITNNRNHPVLNAGTSSHFLAADSILETPMYEGQKLQNSPSGRKLGPVISHRQLSEAQKQHIPSLNAQELLQKQSHLGTVELVDAKIKDGKLQI